MLGAPAHLSVYQRWAKAHTIIDETGFSQSRPVSSAAGRIASILGRTRLGSRAKKVRVLKATEMTAMMMAMRVAWATGVCGFWREVYRGKQKGVTT